MHFKLYIPPQAKILPVPKFQFLLLLLLYFLSWESSLLILLLRYVSATSDKLIFAQRNRRTHGKPIPVPFEYALLGTRRK